MASGCPVGLDCSEDLGPSVIAVVSPVLALAIISVIARLYCRYLTGHRWMSSDYACIVGLLVSTALSGICLFGPRFGLGRHIEVVPLPDLERLLISLWVGQILYGIALTTIKISILLLYRQLFPTRGIDLATKIIGAICIAWGIETILVGIFSCTPIKAFWDVTEPNPTCINSTVFYIANSTPHVILDMAILVLPIRKVWGLKMSLRQKVVVCCMFLLGGFICVIGVIRLIFLVTMNLKDPTYSLYDTYIWSSLELNVATICASLPTLRPLFIKLIPRTGATNASRTRNTGLPHQYGTQTHTEIYRSRLQRHTMSDNFERLDDCQLGELGSVSSKTEIVKSLESGIVVTHEVAQEHEVGNLEPEVTEQQIWGRRFMVSRG